MNVMKVREILFYQNESEHYWEGNKKRKEYSLNANHLEISSPQCLAYLEYVHLLDNQDKMRRVW